MDEAQTEQVKQAALIHAAIHFAEKQVQRQYTELEDLLRKFTPEQVALFVSMTKAQEDHWKSHHQD
jgi:hypothetical protein